MIEGIKRSKGRNYVSLQEMVSTQVPLPKRT